MEGKKLYRSKDDRVIAGVAGGLAEYFNIDSTLVRIIIVILAIWGGFGLLAYIIGALVIPEEPGGDLMAEKKSPKTPKKTEPVVVEQRTTEREVFDFKRMQGEQIFGLIILFIGLIFLLEAFIPGFSFGKLWPLILIGLGLWMLAGQGRD